MDNNVTKDNETMTGINTQSLDLPSIVEQNYKTFVPKIRIRLRPKSDQIKTNCQSKVYGTLTDQSESVSITTKVTKTDEINQSSDTECYKILEDSGGGGGGANVDSNSEVRHNYLIHGINLRARLPKPLNISKKIKKKENGRNENKRNISYHIENENVNKPPIKSISSKNPYKSFILNTSKNHRRNDKNNRKSVSKIRNEILQNINLKDIINQENFLKLSTEMQWQLANLLPNCDKPKSQDNLNNCHCSDVLSTVNEHHRLNPTVNFTAFNNEFLGKALTKYTVKMGQCDLINLLTSERENLRSRPVTLLTEDTSLLELKENVIKVETCDGDKNDDNENDNDKNDVKVSDDVKSNSSVCTTDTMEMNGTGNLLENIVLKVEPNEKYEEKFSASCDNNEESVEVNEASSMNDKHSAKDSQCDKVNVLEGIPLVNNNTSQEDNKDLENKFNPSEPLIINANNIAADFDASDAYEENCKKKARKRKCASVSDDMSAVPVKRSNRSTAGKRPARLDSESPPTSPNNIPNTDKKNNINKCKKQKENNRNGRKCRIKLEDSSDELDVAIKVELDSKKHFSPYDDSKNPKNCGSSPESLPTESELSPLSKTSPNESSVLSSLCRSSLTSVYNDKKTSSHVQTLSPSWSCTSESTTPSVKSDCGQMPPSKTSPTLNISTLCHLEMKSVDESEMKSIQGMPPPRQTLTLAAMREKMRAKKLAKEDNRKDPVSPTKRLSSTNHVKNKKQSMETASLLKEGDDDFQLMDKMMSSSEDFDDLLNNSQESLLEFFMGDDNYDFDSNVDPCTNINSSNTKQSNETKPLSKHNTFVEDTFSRSEVSYNCEEMNFKHESVKCPELSLDNCHSKQFINKSSLTPPTSESTQSSKSIADTIATVLQKFNCSKENGLVVNNCATKSSVPNAYLVDGNGLSTALSIIQSLNPGAKVTTQQFYLVNSGPQLILQPSPSNNIISEKPMSLNTPNKVSLAPKISNQPSIVRQPSILSNSLSSTNDGFSNMPINHLTFAPNVNDKSHLITSDSLNQMRSSCLKMSLSDSKNTYMMSPITHNVPHINQLQTISTPHPIGLVHSVQPSLPSLFSSQLRFIHPSLTNHTSPNTISLIAPNIPSVNTTPIVNHNQSPKLVFFCPTVPNNTVTTSNVINQDQKYLLLSKQPDKQATIQLLSSQGLWQQLNPSLISQSNNLLLMQPQPLNNFDSLLCSNLHNIGVNVAPDLGTLNERNRLLDLQHQVQQQKQQYTEPSTSSLIIDSRSLISKLSSPSQVVHDDVISTLSSPMGYTPLTSSTMSSNNAPFYTHEDTTKVDLNTLRLDATNIQQPQDLSQS